MRKAYTVLSLAVISVLIYAFSGVDRAVAIANAMVPLTANNDQGNGAIDPGYISVSSDGRYVSFISSSSNLVSNDTNNRQDAFVRDTKLNITTRVSVSTAGVQSNQSIDQLTMTKNGRFVLMSTKATNLVSPSQGSTDHFSLYLRDIKNGETHMISASSIGTPPQYMSTSYAPYGLSEDGRFIYYRKQTNGSGGLFIKDRVLNTETRIDADEEYIGGETKASLGSSMSCDGRFVVFYSEDGLVAGDTNNIRDIHIVDRMDSDTVKNITLGTNGDSVWPKITCDGNHIFFHSDASNLTVGDTNNFSDIFKYSIAEETFELVSLDANGNQYGNPRGPGGIDNGHADMSIDGRYVVFTEAKYDYSNSPGFAREYSKIVLRDTKNNTSTYITPGNPSYSSWPYLTYDGRTVYHAWSSASNNSFPRLYSATDYL